LPLPVVPLVVWVNAFTLWKPEAVRITKGNDQLATYQKTEISQRQYCRKCGGHLMTTYPTFGLVDIFSATLPDLKFSPGVHVNYAETVLPMRDGLPKLKDFPKEFSGSRRWETARAQFTGAC
jgi:hypothetical protein